MSEMSPDKIERDAELTAIYRAAAQDAPPAALDAAIRAAARRAVGARPRPAGFAFGPAWHLPLSIAAVMVLSVSIVILMREEAPELTVPPRAEMPAADAQRKAGEEIDERAAANAPGFVRDPQSSKNTGLKSPPGAQSATGMLEQESAARGPQVKKDNNAARLDAGAAAPAELAKRREGALDDDAARDNKIAASTARQGKAAELYAQREIAQAPAAPQPQKEAAKPAQVAEPAAGSPMAGSVAGGVASAPAENKAKVGQVAATADRVDPAARLRAQVNVAPGRQIEDAPPAAAMAPPPAVAPPQARAVSPAVALDKLERAADLPPEKWLERIDELRKLGKVDEAKASFAEFRKRYPDFRLPESLRDWAKP